MSIIKDRRGAGYLLYETDPQDVLTPEDMDDEERMMMDAIKDFAKKEVHPVMEEIEKRNWEVIQPLFRKAADLGIFMAEVPEEYGGLGLSVLGIAGMNESRAYLGDMASTIFAHQGIGTLPLINFGTPKQVEKYLGDCMTGEKMAAFALTEPSSGSDAMNIKTTAVLSEDGSHYVVNGSKQFITNAGWADLFILFTKIDGTHFTAFLLDRDTPGLSVGENEKLLGLHGSSVCGLTLDNVEIPAENLLGEVGKGHKVALCTLNLGRLKMSANCVGNAKKILRIAAEYAAERHQFGNPIAEFGLIEEKLAEMAARAYAAESMSYRTAGLVYQAIEAAGQEARQSIDVKLKVLSEFSIECALAKVFGTETFNGLADECLQIHGGYGFSEEYPAAKLYRDSRITRIYEGTSEICRITAVKAMLRRSLSDELDFDGAVKSLDSSGKGEGADGGDDLSSLQGRIKNLKNIFVYLWGKVLDRFGPEQVLDNSKQQYLGNLADVAMEIYAAESAVLRVLKLRRSHSEDATAVQEAMARLYFEKAAASIREKATQTLAALFDGETLRDELKAIEAWLPLPANRIELRGFIARAVVEHKGALPELRN